MCWFCPTFSLVVSQINFSIRQFDHYLILQSSLIFKGIAVIFQIPTFSQNTIFMWSTQNTWGAVKKYPMPPCVPGKQYQYHLTSSVGANRDWLPVQYLPTLTFSPFTQVASAKAKTTKILQSKSWTLFVLFYCWNSCFSNGAVRCSKLPETSHFNALLYVVWHLSHVTTTNIS